MYEVKIEIKNFKGKVILSNCINGSRIVGLEGGLGIEGLEIVNCSIKFDVNTNEKRRYVVKPPADNETVFAVLGDSQGQNRLLESILEDASKRAEFAIHCGDLTPSGRMIEYDEVERVLNDTKLA
ncbi:MAG: hypothetical protein QXT63_07785, partial [Thermoplasmata archaeon]